MHNEIINRCQSKQRIAEAVAVLASDGPQAVLDDRWI